MAEAVRNAPSVQQQAHQAAAKAKQMGGNTQGASPRQR